MAMTGRELTDAARQSISKVSNERIHEQLTAGVPLVVLDVREQDEWDAGHIAEATFLPRGRLEGRVEQMVPDKSTPVVTH